MGEINLSPGERQALESIDDDALRARVDQAFRDGNAYALRTLRLDACGPYVAQQLRYFESALAEHEKANAPRKRAETESRLRRARDDLVFAVDQMQARAKKEAEEGKLFFVEEHVPTPFSWSEHLSVQVSYRWRSTEAEPWVHGSVTFTHEVTARPDYSAPAPKRKPSQASQHRARQDALFEEWDHLRRLALHAVQDHFRNGGTGSTIPATFKAKADPRTGELNNFSADF